MWRQYNPNPTGARLGDCAVRAICAATGQTWERAYAMLCAQGMAMHDMPSSNAVWGAYLRTAGFERLSMPELCSECKTVRDVAAAHPSGVFVLALDGHVVTLADGDWFDTWDSGDEPVLYTFVKGE